MRSFIDRENQIFEVLQDFNERGLEFVVVGGYAVSAFQHRFSVDADLVIEEGELGRFTEILSADGFQKAEEKELDTYGGRFVAYEKEAELPVSIDLLINSLQSRQTGAAWSYDYFRQHSWTEIVEGSERSVEVRVPTKELLIAVKLHSGRLTDVRDVVALASDTDPAAVEEHLNRGDEEQLEQVLETVDETIDDDNFKDAFKGVFSQQQMPEDNIERIQELIRRQTD